MVAKNKQNSKATLTNETMMALAGFDQRYDHLLIALIAFF